MLIECVTEKHSKCFLKSTSLANVSPYSSINTSKGVIRCRYLEGVSNEEVILENRSSQDITDVRRIEIRRNNELVQTNTFILTFSTSKWIKAGYLMTPLFQILSGALCIKITLMVKIFVAN